MAKSANGKHYQNGLYLWLIQVRYFFAWWTHTNILIWKYISEQILEKRRMWMFITQKFICQGLLYSISRTSIKLKKKKILVMISDSYSVDDGEWNTFSSAYVNGLWLFGQVFFQQVIILAVFQSFPHCYWLPMDNSYFPLHLCC